MPILMLPTEPQAVAVARDALDRLEPPLAERDLRDAKLLLSELVSNSVRHAKGLGDIEVALEREDDVLLVRVEDGGSGFPVGNLGPRDEIRPHGWGLRIVDRVSHRWGRETGERSCVWFELALMREGARQMRERARA